MLLPKMFFTGLYNFKSVQRQHCASTKSCDELDETIGALHLVQITSCLETARLSLRAPAKCMVSYRT